MSLFHSLQFRGLAVVACFGLLVGCISDANKTPAADILVSNDFEGLARWMGEPSGASLTEEIAHSGHYSIKVDGNTEFSLSFNSTLGALHDVRLKKIKISGWVFVPSAQAAALLVTHVGDAVPNTKPLLWDGFDVVKEAGNQYSQWVQVSKVLDIPEAATADTNIGFYLWRHTASNQPVYLDDLVVTAEPST